MKKYCYKYSRLKEISSISGLFISKSCNFCLKPSIPYPSDVRLHAQHYSDDGQRNRLGPEHPTHQSKLFHLQ